MDEEISIINTNTRNEKIKNFFIKNKKLLIISILLIILMLFGYLFYQDFKNKSKIKLSNNYNQTTINFISGKKNQAEKKLTNIVMKKDKTYSPLALYFLIDNNIIIEKNKINILFDSVINQTNLEKEIRNLLIYKKALINSNFDSENNLIEILKPIINSDSIWKSHALHLMAEYFYYKNQKLKAKEFLEKILVLKNSNPSIKIAAQKRLNRDFSE